MDKHSPPRPLFVWLLMLLLVLLGLGGFGGGLVLLFDPSGGTIGLPDDLLAGLPFTTFTLPGLFLVGVMGVAPFTLAYGLTRRSRWSGRGTVGLGILLILWIFLQIYLWGPPQGIQMIYMLWGLVLTVTALLPCVRAHLGIRDL